ncbi:bifunctional metallophosphatase/5'-nucleotidase [Stigmatella aurantiaca]|nr:bifunctional UDP-sugar hydrolase/5'-nucleotidase [Stigmatella aurantiaca]
MNAARRLPARPVMLMLSLFLAAGCPSTARTVPPPETVHITLLHLNDVYQFTPLERGSVGGLARVATLRKRTLAESPNTLTLFAGDTLGPSVESLLEVNGKPLHGRHMIDAWNAVGVDYAVPGNHEFDYGDAALKESIQASHFPWLAANIFDNHTGQPFEGMVPYALREVGGVKIGLFGVLVPDTEVTSSVSQDTNIRDVCSTARPVVSRLRAQGATLIIALTHLDLALDQELARCVSVDLIVGGHEHYRLEDRSTGTPIFKVEADARELGRLDLDVDGRTGKLRTLGWQVFPVTDAIPDDPAFAEAMRPYDTLVAELSQPLGSTPVPLDARKTAVRSQETNLASLVTDTFRQVTGTDVVLVNAGAIRGDTIFPAGPLTRRDLLAIFPFRDELVRLDVTGATLLAALENGVSKSAEDPEPGRFPQVSGLRFSFDPSLPRGQRVLCATVDGKAVSPSATYSLAVTRFISGGKDGYEMLRGIPAKPILPEGRTPRDVVGEALRTGKPRPRSQGDGRIQRIARADLRPGECAPPPASR